MTHLSLEEWIEHFEWESETQHKGFLALVQFLGRRSQTLPLSEMPPYTRLEDALMATSAFFIQKDHEANEWFGERIGDADKRYIDLIADLTEQVRGLRLEVEQLTQRVQRLS